MQRFFLFALLAFTSGSLAAMARPGIEVQVGAEDNYGWQGPGWYYGHYFDNEDDYIAWRQGQAPYYGGTSEAIWIGPGWYGGYWYWNEDEWRRHYHHHYYNHDHDHDHRHDHHDHDRGDHSHPGIQERRENRGGDHGDRRSNLRDRGGGHRGGGGGGHR